jgi:hypothetical protein
MIDVVDNDLEGLGESQNPRQGKDVATKVVLTRHTKVEDKREKMEAVSHCKALILSQSKVSKLLGSEQARFSVRDASC